MTATLAFGSFPVTVSHEGPAVAVTEKPRFTWKFYATPLGAEVVRDEIHAIFQGKPPLAELGALMSRIQYDATLPRDVKNLGEGLREARLTYVGSEYRLYFIQGAAGDLVLLALHFHQKKGNAGQRRAVDLARKRLSDWRGRRI